MAITEEEEEKEEGTRSTYTHEDIHPDLEKEINVCSCCVCTYTVRCILYPRVYTVRSTFM